MAAAIGILTLGVIFVYSALKGVGVVDVLAGIAGDPLNPAGGKREFPQALADAGFTPDEITDGIASGPLDTTIGGAEFKGPHASKLNSLRKLGEDRYNLTRGQSCRPQNAGYGAPNSRHKACRAFDYGGAVADRIAFSNYVATLPWVEENFCDQAGRRSPGYEHTSHGHVGA